MKNKLFMPLKLQFFAEGEVSNGNSEGANSTQEGQNNSEGGNSTNGGESGSEGTKTGAEGGEKTFTQAEMTATATKEKRAGKNAILKLFGCADEKAAKEEAVAYLAWKESQKTEEQKQQEATDKLKTDKTDAEKRATLAENKLAAFMSGVNKDSIEDALAIASLKVTEDKDLAEVLEEMKTQPKYKGFFSSGEPSGKGTGSGVSHGNRGGNNTENIGERLGKQNAKVTAKKSSYFKN